jgi:endonuclease YncB( thermonuclease family)
MIAMALTIALAPGVRRGAAAAPKTTMPTPSTGVVARVIDGDTLVLAGGASVRLVGIQAPKLPLGRPGFTPWPLAAEAKAMLARLTVGKELRLRYGGQRIDRYRRLLAHLHDSGGRWIQGAMLEAGLARVYTFRDNVWRAGRMLGLERAARAARRGIWAERFYRIRTPDETSRDIGSFQIVEGRVVGAAVVRGRLFINFGRDWRRDFTATVAPRQVRGFAKAGLTPARLAGRLVRVRGWLRAINGPSISLTHPAQIELVRP